MNLLRKNIASSISLTNKSSNVSLYLSSLIRKSRPYSVQTAEYEKRNYANNISEYNTVIGSLIAQRSPNIKKILSLTRPYLLRDVYDDMMLDGVNLYNFLISACGKCKDSNASLKLFQEMKIYGVKPKRETYICLLNALAASGRTDQVYEVVRDMTAAGLSLDKFCYAGLITAYKNKTPVSAETFMKIVEYVEQSLKGWSSGEQPSDGGESFMMNVLEEELYNMPTSEFVHRRGFVARQLTVFHVALHACADLKSKETMEKVLDMLKAGGYTYDTFIAMQVIRCYLQCGDLDSGLRVFEEYTSSRPPTIELYVTFVEGAMVGYTERGMQLAQKFLETMNARGFFLNPRMGCDLLLAAAGEKTGGYVTANYIWDMLQSRKIVPTLPAVEAYHRGLKQREIPADDPRLLVVQRTLDDLQSRFGPRRNNAFTGPNISR
ncbi:pentatricopeptide repeat-containing protein [Carex littledalei]|uniref:Pentatricopeptide repeat-containing protein n=1 Tax=Carex littledalei TaxID=544730 RepID=A0A833VHX7_9POAL|nr:pentatricopeptide repeat-containing protein [Carex littledalei]